jgi:microcystin degradation protein MlrC
MLCARGRAGGAGDAGGEAEAALRREWARLEAAIRLLGDPGSSEAAVSRRAGARIAALLSDLDLGQPPGQAAKLAEMAQQARGLPARRLAGRGCF